jgi:cellobiose-specific phosphotransferase system component IIA
MSREQALKALSSATEAARAICEDTKQSAPDRIAAAHAVRHVRETRGSA